MVTLAVYTFFVASLMGQQLLYDKDDTCLADEGVACPDLSYPLYVPVFAFLQVSLYEQLWFTCIDWQSIANRTEKLKYAALKHSAKFIVHSLA